jgi:HK97 family phage portal protein
VTLNFFQKAFRKIAAKALGFPVWGTTGPWPGGFSGLGSGPQQPLELAAVYGCARVLCQTIGSLPLDLYKEDAAGRRTKAVDDPLYPILHSSPNAFMTSMEFREALILGFCLYGNGYAQIVKLGGRVVSLNPLRADRMRVMFLPPDYQTLVYRYSHFNGKTQDYQPEEILHVKNFSMDGLMGLSPIRKYMIEHALEAQNYGRNFFKNGGRPQGVLTFKGKRPVSEEVNNKIRADWSGIYGGTENAGKTAVLWEEGKYEPISVPPDEAQYILTRQLSMAEIAGGIYGVPLNMLGHTDKTATYASAEQFDIQFAKHTVRPLAVRIEEAINHRLLATKPGVTCKMDLDELQRGDSTAQANYFSNLTQNGVMTRNEARRKLNLPEIKGGDELTVQSNLIDLDKLASVTNRNVLPPKPAPTTDDEDDEETEQ